MKVVGIIPARFESTRFPGKPLAKILDKPMIQWVYERAKKSKTIQTLIVATDSIQVYNQVKDFGAEVVLTSKEHQSGTSRVAEVSAQLDVEIVVNIQGDEPLISPDAIDEVVKPLITDPTIYMATLKQKITDENELSNPNVVKVVTDKDDFALYFSRSLIPFVTPPYTSYIYKHIGLYVYRKDFLLKLVQLPPTKLEQVEKLEQLRVLENGYKIKVIKTGHSSIGVDTEEDLEKVSKILKQEAMVSDNSYK
ncbi:MAG: 3-deoxy-manno-octulosonate cytidylyltransferase [bacterium]